jgi:hypothetical protein
MDMRYSIGHVLSLFSLLGHHSSSLKYAGCRCLLDR